MRAFLGGSIGLQRWSSAPLTLHIAAEEPPTAPQGALASPPSPPMARQIVPRSHRDPSGDVFWFSFLRCWWRIPKKKGNNKHREGLVEATCGSRVYYSSPFPSSTSSSSSFSSSASSDYSSSSSNYYSFSSSSYSHGYCSSFSSSSAYYSSSCSCYNYSSYCLLPLPRLLVLLLRRRLLLFIILLLLIFLILPLILLPDLLTRTGEGGVHAARRPG